MTKKSILTDEQKTFLLKHHSCMTLRELCYAVGHKWTTSVRRFLSKEGKKPKRIGQGKRKSTLAEKTLILNQYKYVPMNRIAKQIGRSRELVSDFIRSSGLVAPIEKFIADNQFKRGEPRCSHYGRLAHKGKVSPTSYKIGNVPPFTKPIGSTRIWNNKGKKYILEKVDHKNKWLLQHRVNWINKNGEIPDGYVLKCRSMDTLNTDPENWEVLPKNVMSDREVAVKMNGLRCDDMVETLLKDVDLIKVKKVQYIIKQKIKHHGREKQLTRNHQ